jgi:hypothetical protein
MYVIRRKGDGKFVNQPGSQSSYTTNIIRAQKFATKEAAEASCCGNEYAVPVHSLMGGADERG